MPEVREEGLEVVELLIGLGETHLPKSSTVGNSRDIGVSSSVSFPKTVFVYSLIARNFVCDRLASRIIVIERRTTVRALRPVVFADVIVALGAVSVLWHGGLLVDSYL